MKTVTALDVEVKLRKWQSGELSAASLYSWAESVHAVSTFEPESEAVNEVLAQLDLMNMNLLTVDDVPVLVKALRSAEAGRILSEHLDSIDFDARKIKLANDPLYARFCK